MTSRRRWRAIPDIILHTDIDWRLTLYWWQWQQWHVKKARQIHNWSISHVLMTKLFRILGFCQVYKSYPAVWPGRWHSIRSPSLECYKIRISLKNDNIVWSTSGHQLGTRGILETFVPLAWQHLQASLDQSCIIYFSLLFSFSHLQISSRR